MFKPRFVTFPFCVVLLLLLFSDAAAAVRYATTYGTGNCSGWNNSCTLQTALTGAGSGDEIWVTGGTHKPTTSTDRTVSFQLKSGVAIYGGFAGTETDRAQRDIVTHITILSGDLNGDDGANFANRGDNSYHVVTGASGATLDGVTISGGNANGTNTIINNIHGGGMYNYNCSPTLNNVIFSGNRTDSNGGGMYNENGSPTLTNITFSGNSAAKSGGGVYNTSSNPVLTNTTVKSNNAVDGAGMYNDNSKPSLTNVTISGNTASNNGGGMNNGNTSAPALTNVTISGNKGYNGGGGVYNDNGNPTLTNVTISGNIAVYGICGGMTSYNSSLVIRNSILWGNIGGMGSGDYCGSLFTHTVSNSILSADCSGGCSNVSSSNPLLGVLGDYGGGVQTIPILPGSPALNAGNTSVCPATDQRGKSRFGACDIGAFESQGYTLTKTDGDYQSAATNAPFATPLKVTLSETGGQPLSGATISFTAPSSGASLTATTFNAITDSSGIAATTVTANFTIGIYSVTAAAPGATSIAFTLFNTAGPIVTGLSPSSGEITGGTPVTISGTYFTGATSVKFGAATVSFTVVSDTQIIATSPAGTSWASAPVTVTTPASTSNASFSFQYLGAPTHQSVALPSGLISWWRGENNTIDQFGGNNGIPVHASQRLFSDVWENQTASLTCDSGTIVSSNTIFGYSSKNITCGSCVIGASSCSITFSVASCGSDPIPKTSKEGQLTMICGTSGGFGFAAGKVGQAFSFNGSSDFVSQGQSYKGVVSNSFTMEFWAKPEATITTSPLSESLMGNSQYGGKSGHRYAIFPEIQSTPTDAGAGVSVGTNKIAVIENGYLYSPALLVYDLVPGDIRPDGWMHIAVVYENKIPRLYVNGLLRRTGLTSPMANVYPSSSFGEAGYGTDPTQWLDGTFKGFYQGLLDEIHIYNRVLNETEIRGIYTADSNGIDITPVITAITPSSGPSAGGTEVVITGRFFTGLTAIKFGANTATDIATASDTRATAISPAGVIGQITDVTVTTPGGTSSVTSADQFTYVQQYLARNITKSVTYNTLAQAITAAASGDEIHVFDSQQEGPFVLDRGLVLRGGYGGDLETTTGNDTTLDGNVTTSTGSSTVESVTVKGVLTLRGGALQARGLTIAP